VIAVLRLGHRIHRDKRITTHVALVARAFGADTMYVSTKDAALETSINAIVKQFGGSFSITTGVHAKTLLSSWNGSIVHLTMYGLPLEKTIGDIPHNKDVLLVIGAEKVPGYVYGVADYNIAVGHQPHSEVAALALFLDRWFKGAWQTTSFDGRITIVPCERGKHVLDHSKQARKEYAVNNPKS